jgi:predicted ATP-grasp superfamily ATP-dependent carboligase
LSRDPAELFELSPAASELASGMVMLYYLDGFIDAGGAGRLFTGHLLSSLEHTEVARFDVDRLLDYRSRRPTMIFAKDHWESYEDPELAVHLLHDAEGKPFLLLSGLEPDREWERFASAVLQISETLRIRLGVSFHGIPMGVPHTRPLGLTGHATRSELIEGYQPFVDRLQVPGSAMSLIELRMARAGLDAVGFAVHVPHYLAHASYPSAAVTVLAAVERATGLNLPNEALHEAAQLTNAEIARQVAGSDDVAEVVRSLEQQYDAFTAEHQDLLAGHPERMPTADELAAQFERFLAEQSGGDSPET